MPAPIVLSSNAFAPPPQASTVIHPAGCSPFETTWRQVPHAFAQFLSVGGVCNVSAVSSALRFVNTREVLPVRLLGKRAEILRLATGTRFPSMVDRVAALAQIRSFRSTPISSLQVSYDASRHGPARRREVRRGPQELLLFGGSHVLCNTSACGRTQVLHRTDLGWIRITRDGAVTVLNLSQPCAGATSMVCVAPDGRTCIALTGGVSFQLHKICLDNAGKWHKAVYTPCGLAMEQIYCMEVTNNGVALFITRAEGRHRMQLHKWEQERGLRSIALEGDGMQRIAASSSDGMALVLRSAEAPMRDSFLLRFDGPEEDAALPYIRRMLPRQQIGHWQGAIGDAVFSSDGSLLAMATAAGGQLPGFSPHTLFFLDVAAAFKLTAPTASINMHDHAIARAHRGRAIPGGHAAIRLHFQANDSIVVQTPQLAEGTPEYVRETHFPRISDAMAVSKALAYVCQPSLPARPAPAVVHLTP